MQLRAGCTTCTTATDCVGYDGDPLACTTTSGGMYIKRQSCTTAPTLTFVYAGARMWGTSGSLAAELPSRRPAQGVRLLTYLPM
jgi:hypothetical protein